ncbi:MAG: glycosyltransferase, partial [Bacteroidales bacterium]|nr:glycosyltransferase [Bacteroidales bacterium]
MSECVASVWLITYNHERFIAEAIESALAQITDFDFEIVIGDDCSTDGTTAIVEKYRNNFPKRIKAVYQDKNVGALRNAYEFTLSQCKGKYIAPLEGDDYWIDPHRLQKQVDFLEKNPEFGLAYGNQYHLEPDGKSHPYKPSIISTFEDLLFNSSIPTASTCLRKDLIDQFASDTSFLSKNWLLADFPLWLWIYQNSKIHYVDEFYSV